MFFGFGFVEFFHIYRLSFPIDTLDFRICFEVCFLHLQGNEPAGQCNHADVMAGSRFNGNYTILPPEGP